MSIKSVILISTAIIVSGCGTTAQYTSGADYLSKYSDATSHYNSQIDRDVREIANIEPTLTFPARIGLARVENGNLTSIPADEAASWADLTNELGASYGEIVPVSPLIAAMVDPYVKSHKSTKTVVDHIRRGAARQHLDHVLIYEVTNKADRKSNSLRVTDLTVLGLFIMPSRKVEIDSTASAMLIDVRNGYPYGTASAYAEKSSVSTAAGSRSQKASLTDKARIIAVEKLTREVDVFMRDLKDLSVSKTASR